MQQVMDWHAGGFIDNEVSAFVPPTSLVAAAHVVARGPTVTTVNARGDSQLLVYYEVPLIRVRVGSVAP